MNVAPAADDHILLSAGKMEIARVVEPAEVAGHEPALRVERRLRRALVIEIAEHQAGAATTDLADFAGCGLGVRIVLAPDAKLIPGAGAPATAGDALGGSSGSVY